MRNSFLRNAQASGVIDHLVFALYAGGSGDGGKNGSAQSSIKFGSVDQSAIAPGEYLTYMKTESTDSWGIKALAMRLAGSSVRLASPQRTALIQPLVPYTYIPKADFLNFKQAALLKFGTRGLRCSHIDCYFEKPCNETLPRLGDLELEVELYHGFPKMVKSKLSIRAERLLVSGQTLQKPEERCYLAVFGQAALDQHTWYLGSQTMADYYTVFDMTPLDEQHKDFIQVGFAKLNPAGLQRQQAPHIAISHTDSAV